MTGGLDPYWWAEGECATQHDKNLSDLIFMKIVIINFDQFTRLLNASMRSIDPIFETS
jgi:hypothetical protein